MKSERQIASGVAAAAADAAGIVVVGGGFGGLYAAKRLARAGMPLTLVDRRNFHLFQPLLYQVASGGLSPGDISYPLRAVLAPYPRARVLLAELIDLDPAARTVTLRATAGGEAASSAARATPVSWQLPYSALIVATGVGHFYFGNDQWMPHAPGLKTVEDSVRIRARVLSAFEAAELTSDPALRTALTTFVVIGGGPTGVELAGAIAELAHSTLRGGFRNVDLDRVRVVLLEAAERVLPPYPPRLSAKAQRLLAQLGVEVRTGAMVEDVADGRVVLRGGEVLQARTVLWTAGIRPTPVAALVAQRAGVAPDRSGRLPVNGDFSVGEFPDLFAIGDVARWSGPAGEQLPGIAPAAIQAGHYVAGVVWARARAGVAGGGQRARSGERPFRYRDRGMLAVIGRNRAVCKIGRLQFGGFFAWILWLVVHIRYLVGFNNRLLVLLQWGWNYATRKRGALLITDQHE